MQQYFVDAKLNVGDKYRLDDEILFHLKKVLRKRNGYNMRLVANGHLYLGELFGDTAKIQKELFEDRELPYDLVLAMALIKNDRFEWAVQKATELGVKRIIPLMTERTQIKDHSQAKRLLRYKKIAKEAAEQSFRLMVPLIDDFKRLEDIETLHFDNKLVAYEREEQHLLSDDLKNDTIVIIGPEGGFSDDEYRRLIENGFVSISLGKRILRAETAAVCALSIIARGME